MYYCFTAARMGVKVYIMMEYSVSRYLLFLDIYRITFLTGVPTLLVALSKHPQAKCYNLKAIESVVTGSAPLNPEIGEMVRRAHLRPGVRVKQGWGLTETTCSATGFAQDDEDDGRSIGWLNPNLSAKIVPMHDQGFEQKDDIAHMIGEIWVSGPNIMQGYYKRPRETAETIVEEDGQRWLRTGDIGYVDNRGCFYIVDRMKVTLNVISRSEDGKLIILPGTHKGERAASRACRDRADAIDSPCSCRRCCHWREEVSKSMSLYQKRG